MNGIQDTKPYGPQCNRLLDVVVTILKSKKITIDHAIYIELFSDGTVYYLKFSTYCVLDTTNNETEFTEIRRFFEE